MSNTVRPDHRRQFERYTPISPAYSNTSTPSMVSSTPNHPSALPTPTTRSPSFISPTLSFPQTQDRERATNDGSSVVISDGDSSDGAPQTSFPPPTHEQFTPQSPQPMPYNKAPEPTPKHIHAPNNKPQDPSPLGKTDDKNLSTSYIERISSALSGLCAALKDVFKALFSCCFSEKKD